MRSAESEMEKAVAYRGNAAWRDMSEYVVHFTRQGDDGTTPVQALINILTYGNIEARKPFGCALNVNGLGTSQYSACFSEIPLDLLDRLVARRESRYGIGFHQNVLLGQHGGRVWYVDPGTRHREVIKESVRQSMVGGVDPANTLWQLTPLIDYVAPNYHFEWEREWRVPGGLRFTPDMVAFLMVSDADVAGATAWLRAGDNGRPVYNCPVFDPLWDDERLQQAIASLP